VQRHRDLAGEGVVRILLVDDEQSIQTLLSYPLRKGRLRGRPGHRRPQALLTASRSSSSISSCST
jgi:hypothetical protein